jgi:hypothetical protein
MFLTRLLDEKAVLKDLDLTEQQAKRAKMRAGEQFGDFWRSLKDLEKLGPDERTKKYDERTQAIENTLAEILTANGLKRLKQIALQQRGADALNDPNVAQALNLTKEQKTQIRNIQAAAPRKAPFGGFGFRGGPGKPGVQDLHVKALNSRMLGVLTREQQAHWVEMMGEPFKGEISRGFKGQCGPGPQFNKPPDRREGPRQFRNRDHHEGSRKFQHRDHRGVKPKFPLRGQPKQPPP